MLTEATWAMWIDFLELPDPLGRVMHHARGRDGDLCREQVVAPGEATA